MQPLCFVLMRHGSGPAPDGSGLLNFDAVYERAIGPATLDAGLEPIRDSAERSDGALDQSALERLLACDYAVVDLTAAEGSMLYALGARHAMRPGTTVCIAARGHPLPLDPQLFPTLTYDFGDGDALGEAEAAALRRALGEQLRDVRDESAEADLIDSALFELLGPWSVPDVSRLKTDVFRDRVQLDANVRARLEEARAFGGAAGVQRLREFEGGLGALDRQPFATLVDLFLSYRAVEAWSEMIRLVDGMPLELRRQVLVREQLAFALNRRAGESGPGKEVARRDRQRALAILAEVERDQGPSGETSGLIGRIHKDEWDDALRDAALAAEAPAHLDNAIAAYVRGFEADSRDAFPGINALTLLDIRGNEASLHQRDELLPVVHFAVRQRLRTKEPDYWDYATLIELAVLASDEAAATEALETALAAVRETWEPATTARNLGLILRAREERGAEAGWLADLIRALEERAAASVP